MTKLSKEETKLLEHAFEANREEYRLCPKCYHELRLDFDTKQFMCDECELLFIIYSSKAGYIESPSTLQLRIYEPGKLLPIDVKWIKDADQTKTVG